MTSFSELVALRYDLAADIYRQRLRALQVESAARKGRILEYWVYKTFGPVITSLALTLNPYWQFDRNLREKSNQLRPGTYSQIPVPVNRTSQFVTIGAIDRWLSSYRYSATEGANRVWTGSGFKLSPYYTLIENSISTSALPKQEQVLGFRKDTTWKTRNPKSGRIPFDKAKREDLGLQSQGEFELWVPKFNASHDSISYGTDTYCQISSSAPIDWWRQVTKRRTGWIGPSARIVPSSLNAVAANEQIYALTSMVKNLDQLLSGSLPSRRKYSALYNIAELKDLPLMLRGTVSAWVDIERHLGVKDFLKALSSSSWWSREKIIGLMPFLAKAKVHIHPDQALADAYLTFKFGWQSTVQAVRGMLTRPSMASKEVNTLLSQDGKLTTLHRQIMLPDDTVTYCPSIVFDTPVGLSPDPSKPFSITGTRSGVKLRCSLNFGVEMPPLDVPSLRDSMVRDKLGVNPRPSDVYNLIPWTWMFDWFTGFGEYLSLCEQVLSDPKLINWGMITYESELSFSASQGAQVISSNSVSTPYFYRQWNVTTSTQMEARCNCTYKIRRDVGSLASVKYTSGRGLDQTQMSILAALISKFSKR